MIPTQLAESGYDIVWVSKYVYKVVSSVDEYVRVYIRVEIRVYYNKKNLVWIFVAGYYILPNLWEFRPRNSKQAWIEECSGTRSRTGSSNPTGGGSRLVS